MRLPAPSGYKFSSKPPGTLTGNILWEKLFNKNYLRCEAQRDYLRKKTHISVLEGHQGQRGTQYAGR